jgi:hypothetical protein
MTSRSFSDIQTRAEREILIQNLQTLQGYSFHILQLFAAKLCNFTTFIKMLFLAVVMDFVLLA